ncbi:MAG: hypothetical protein M5U08_18550 [Burkholderiales bacterium]|nr:hypothetical protein [Burkholderiales bacterium]
MPEPVDALRMALLSVCRDTHAPLHMIHVHVEDWLARPLAPGELEQAIGELARAGLLGAYRRERSGWTAFSLPEAAPLEELRFLTTAAGAAAAYAAWRRFFEE